jgi:NitT/TauT family transport system permease protein
MDKLHKFWPPLLLIAALVGLWHYAVVTTQTVIFPTPQQVLDGTLELSRDGTLWQHIGSSLKRVAAGFMLASSSPCRSVCGWAGSGRSTTR